MHVSLLNFIISISYETAIKLEEMKASPHYDCEKREN